MTAYQIPNTSAFQGESCPPLLANAHYNKNLVNCILDLVSSLHVCVLIAKRNKVH